jgi:hypothetical protein
MFKNIIGYDYAINEAGEVRNNKTGRILKACANKHGYLLVELYKDGEGKCHYIHSLLGDYFLGCPPGKSIDHIDRNRSNNNLSNLRVVTSQQNQFNRNNTKGYTWSKQSCKWKAQICVNGDKRYLGLYTIEEDARSAYLTAKAILHVMP